MLDILNKHRQDGNEYYDGDNVFDVLLNSGDGLSQEIPRECHARNPTNPSSHIEQSKPAILHLGDAGNNRRECSRKRHEPRKDDGYPAVLFIEFLSLDEVIASKPPRLGFAKERLARTKSDVVTHSIPRNSCNAQKNIQPNDIKMNAFLYAGREQSCRYEKRIARQEKTDQQSCFGKNDGKEADVTAPDDDLVQCGEMGEESNKLFQAILKV